MTTQPPRSRNPRRRGLATRPFDGLGLLGGVALLAFVGAVLAQDKVLYETDSAFNHILVTEDSAGVRSLLFAKEGALQSVGKATDPDFLSLAYLKTAFVGLGFVEKPQRVLVVGLGGASIPRFLHRHYPAMQIDCAELDPEVISVAKRFFGFVEDNQMRAFAGDGRKFIEEVKKPYDVIFLDAFGADSIPYRLATREFLVAVRKALTRDGIAVGNIWSRSSNPLYDSMVRTYQDVFAELYLFTVAGSGNRILVGMSRKAVFTREEIVSRTTALAMRDQFPYPLGEVAAFGYARLTGEPMDAKVLLDLNPSKTGLP